MKIEILKVTSLFASLKDIESAERKKTRLENDGYNLICSTSINLTYAKPAL